MSKKLKPCPNCGGVGIVSRRSYGIHVMHGLVCDGTSRKDNEGIYEKLPCGLRFQGFVDEITLPTLKKRWNKLYDKVHKQEEDL